MAADQVSFTFECTNCGGAVLMVPDDQPDDAMASCKSCGTELARYDDIKAKCMELAVAEVNRLTKPVFEDIKRTLGKRR